MNTNRVLNAVLKRLKEKLPIPVEFFPDRAACFRLNHDIGTCLLSYGKSTYGKVKDTSVVIQPQTLRFTATLVFRQLNGNQGAIEALDWVRRALGGFRPPDCKSAIIFIDDVFLGELNGLWQYAISFETQSFFIESEDEEKNH